MEMKTMAAAFALLAFAGASFAFLGNGAGLMANAEEITDEVRLSFMKAVHEGDYATAKSLSDEYGIGGRMLQSEELFSLRYQMREAMDAGDYESALELQEQVRELRQEQGAQGQNGGFGKGAGRGRGMGQGMRAGGCPYADAQ